MGLSFSLVILGSTVRCYAMEFLIIGLFAAIVAFLIWRSKQNTDPKEQACAIEIGNLLKANPDARPQAVADVFIKHGIDHPRIAHFRSNFREPLLHKA